MSEKGEFEAVVKDRTAVELKTEIIMCTLMRLSLQEYKDYQKFQSVKQRNWLNLSICR